MLQRMTTSTGCSGEKCILWRKRVIAFIFPLFSINRHLNELNIATYACVYLITVAISNGEQRPALNTPQMYLVYLYLVQARIYFF